MFVSRWTVDYGDGPHPVVVPHAWAQEVSVEWEGPAVYRAEVEVPRSGGTLRFHGVSYATEVFANGTFVRKHEGTWDAFDVPLPGGKVALEVRVVKNGGPTYPVASVASGGLPYLFHTFGGIYREVELLEPGSLPLALPAPKNGPPVPYVRGVVHRGWYPDLGHPNPDEMIVRRELREIKALGFNLVKFAGWVPPHRYLDFLEAEGILGWLELPLGGMHATPEGILSLFDEAERIVRQYRHHSALALWSLGDAYLGFVPIKARSEIVRTLRALTGAWVGDGTDGRFGEANDFDDLRTVGDPSEVNREMRLLHPGPREPRPALIGEVGAAHVHRDLARLGDELPFWASSLEELNARGVRLGGNLANVLERSRFAVEPTRNGHRALMASSRSREAFVRKTVLETVRAGAGWVRGYAVEELRDTPVSSSGLFDDWGVARLQAAEAATWNGPACLFPMEMNRWSRLSPPDPLNHFAGRVRLRIGLHSEPELTGRLWWRILDETGRVCARGAGEAQSVEGAREVGTIVCPEATPGSYRLEAGFGDAENAWDLWVVEEPEWSSREGWRMADPDDEDFGIELPGGEWVVAYHHPADAKGGILLLDEGDEGTLTRYLWNECAFHFIDDAFWAGVSFRERWSRLLPVSNNAALDPKWLKATFGEYETLLDRIDTSPYGHMGDAPIVVRAGGWIVTTLRCAIDDLDSNPAACALLASLMDAVQGATISE